jgi:predicted transposase YdaD
VLPDNDHEEWLSPFQRMLREQRAEGLAEGREEGRAEGEARGSRTALASALLQQLTQRFGPIHDSARSRIESADLQPLQRWFTRVLDAKSIDDALED